MLGNRGESHDAEETGESLHLMVRMFIKALFFLCFSLKVGQCPYSVPGINKAPRAFVLLESRVGVRNPWWRIAQRAWLSDGAARIPPTKPPTSPAVPT